MNNKRITSFWEEAFFFKSVLHFIVIVSGLDCTLVQWVQLLLPLLFLGLQLLCLLGEPAVHRSSLCGPHVQGLVLLSLVEFPEVFLLSLLNDSEDTDDGFAYDSYLGELGQAPPVTLAT